MTGRLRGLRVGDSGHSSFPRHTSDHPQHEHNLSFGFSDRSKTLANVMENHPEAGGDSMAEFIRSSLIILMGMTVMVAGILVIFYG